MIYKSMTQLIGNTPSLQLVRFCESEGLNGNIIAKLENLEPMSVKDRIALNMIIDAEKSGKLAKGGTIIEPTSGNTGIGLAWVAAAHGYKMVLVMPESMSIERRKLAAQFGAEVVLTPAAEGMRGAIAKAEQLIKVTPNSFMPMQFSNPANPAAHIATAKEILADTENKVDIFVCGVGTGGTITGVGNYLKSIIKGVKVVAVEPIDSNVLSGGKAGAHKLQGIGAGFIPECLDTSVYDEVITITAIEAFSYAKAIAKTEGLLVGISSGAALAAAAKLAARKENSGKNIVTLLPDTGERYLSTPLFDN